MNSATGWFVAALIMLVILAMYAPRFAGVIVLLIGTYLALKAANKGLLEQP